MTSQLKSGVPCVLAYARPTCCRRNKPSNLGGLKLPSPTSRLVRQSGQKQSLTQLRSVVVRAASETQMAVDRSACFTSDFYRRPLHWVFKVGDLKKTLDFYENLLGMRVFRHEEFASGCEATCNGPYAGAWSKTMVGYGSEDTNFALELTYNYGIEGYQSGNDYRYIALRSSALKGDPASLGYEVEQCGEGKRMVAAPDGYKFMLVDDVEGGEDVEEPFLFVSTHVTDIARAKQFFTEVVGAYEYEGVPGAVGGENSVMLGFARPAGDGDVNWPCVKLELVQLEGAELDHAEASGRFATETQDGAQEAMAEQLRAAGHEGLIKHGPLRLQPHNEEVLIFTDADDNEFCFVDARCYTNCMDVAKRPGGAVVDWDYRGKLLEAALANDTLATAKLLAGDYDPQATQDSITATTSANAVVVYSQTTCPYCNKAKDLLTELGAKFEVVDLDKLEAQGHAIRAVLGESSGQTSLPHIFINGTSIGGFTEGLEKLHNDAKLEPMLQEAGAL